MARFTGAALALGVLVASAACGGSSSSHHPSLTVFAGVPSGAGNLDGLGSAARFNGPQGVAADKFGNVYVADSGNNTIRKVTPAGEVTTLAGMAGQSGCADGTGSAARFNDPRGVAVDGAGNVYVADSGNNSIRKVTPAGEVTTLAGTEYPMGSADGTGADARFDHPQGVAVDGAGNVYVADSGNDSIRKVTPAGEVTTLAGSEYPMGSADGTGAAAGFWRPSGVAVDGVGTVYVADSDNNTIRKVTPAGVVTTLAGKASQSGSADGTGAAASFSLPCGVAVDGAGNLYVADTYNSTIRKVTPAGVVTTLAGGQVGSADGTGAAASLWYPSGLAVDGVGNVYVADTGNNTIRKVTLAGAVTTLAGLAGQSGSADGASADARFNDPNGVAVDGAGNVYVADTGKGLFEPYSPMVYSSNETIRKITPAGVVTTLAGKTGQAGGGDGTGAAASFWFPSGVAVDGAGNVYVADTGNNTIRKVTPSGVVTTLAGTARQSGSADGTGAAASFALPYGVAVDGAGNVYVADTYNSTIRKITAAGVVTTLAGTAELTDSADGTGAAARFTYPNGVAVDGVGNVYVADTGSNTIRKVTPAGVVTTLAGKAWQVGNADGTGAAARFNDPRGVAVDRAGNVYVADRGNNSIRKVTPAGVVTTIAGSPLLWGTIAGPLPSSLSSPFGVAVDPTTGNLFVVLPDAVVEVWL